MICLSGCGKKQRFIERCTQNDLSYNICECMYTEVSQQIEDTDGFIEWFVAANKKMILWKILCEEQRMQDYCQIWCIVL